jgi:hypothetical protein
VSSSKTIDVFTTEPDQLLKDEAHIVVADLVGTQVRRGYLLHDLKQQIGLIEQSDELAELEVLEDLAGVDRKAIHIIRQVALDGGAV